MPLSRRGHLPSFSCPHPILLSWLRSRPVETVAGRRKGPQRPSYHRLLGLLLPQHLCSDLGTSMLHEARSAALCCVGGWEECAPCRLEQAAWNPVAAHGGTRGPQSGEAATWAPVSAWASILFLISGPVPLASVPAPFPRAPSCTPGFTVLSQ